MQNPVLAALKIIVLTVFAVFLALDLFATQNLEDKVLRTKETMDKLSDGVAETNRRIDGAVAAAREAKEAADRSYERLDALLDAMERGVGVAAADGGGRPPRVEDTAPRVPTGDVTSEPSVIAGKKVYPRNPGWTVLCDKDTNDDPKRDVPVDMVDWDASLHLPEIGEPKGLNFYSDDRTVTLSAWAHWTTDQLAMRKSTDITEWNAMLAERIEESPDRTQYMIYLRKGVRWHRPTLDLKEYPWLDKSFEVTASDVKFTVDMILDANAISPLKVYFDEITDIEILDPHTLKITWKRPNFYARATTLEIMPLPEHVYAYDPSGHRYPKDTVGAQFNNHWYGNKNILGNGPYRFAQYEQGVRIRWERNDNYWGQRAPCREFYLDIVTDEETRLAKFWNGELTIHSLRPEQYRRVILEGEQPEPVRKYDDRWRPPPKSWKYTYYSWLPPVYGGFAWNMRRPALSDARVRRALTMCLNRDKIIDKLLYGLGQQIAVGETVTSIYYPKGMAPLPFDIEGARRLLDEAGWKEGPTGIREKVINGQKRELAIDLVLAAASAFQTDVGQLFKEDLQKAGVKLTLNPIQSALWAQKNSERDFDGLIIYWYAGIDSDPKQLWDSAAADEPGSNNYPGFKDAEADGIFDTLVNTFDYDKRVELMHRWYAIQEKAQPYTWIYHVKSFSLVNADWRFPEPKLDFPYVDHRLTWRWKSRP